ncbi:hypothetical protein SDJN03_12081, partial [Cucurbita argyrosperma subsp. sororia]
MHFMPYSFLRYWNIGLAGHVANLCCSNDKSFPCVFCREERAYSSPRCCKLSPPCLWCSLCCIGKPCERYLVS